MNPSGGEKDSHPSLFGLQEISLNQSPNEIPLPLSRIKLPEQDPFSLKVIQQLEREGLFIRWRFGYRLANRYEVRRIHAGGMGIVWIVEDVFDDRKPYAAKSVKPFFRKPGSDEEWKRREKAIQRFLEECKIWVDLEKHRHIVYAEFLEKIEGVPLVMSEYIEGGDLRELIKESPLPLEQVLDIAIHFCEGMAYANKRGVVVHRDIKPDNIMITAEGVVKVNDFGLTRAIGGAEEIREAGAGSIPVEHTGSISRGFGTLSYMAPEQFDKKLLKHMKFPVQAITGACDVFAFGLTLHEMLKGKHAYEEDRKHDAELHARARQIAAELSLKTFYPYYFLKAINLNPAGPITPNKRLDAVILKCLRQKAAERYSNFSELKKELLGIYQKATKQKYRIIKEAAAKPNYKNRGKTAFILGREDEAVQSYEKAIKENPGDTDAWLEKGLVMAEMGDLREFKSCMEIISFIKPSKSKTVQEHENRITDSGIISYRDIRMLKNIAKKYHLGKKINEFITRNIPQRDDEQFKEFNPELKKHFELLREKNSNIRQDAIFALSKFRDPMVMCVLIECLKDADAQVRGFTATVLKRLQTPEAIPALKEAFEDNDPGVRRSVANALAVLKDFSVAQYFMEDLQKEHIHNFINAIQVLGDLKATQAIPQLIDALKNGNTKVRKSAIEALGKFKDISLMPHIINAMNDKDAHVRETTALLLGELLYCPAIPYLREALKDKHYYVAISAAKSLGKLKDLSGIHHLMNEALKNEDGLKQLFARGALKELKNPDIIPQLINALRDENSLVRGNAAWALGELRDQAATPYLVELLGDKDSWVRESAAWALGELRDSSIIPHILIILNDEDPNVRESAVDALGKFKDITVAPYVLEAINDEDAVVRTNAIQTLVDLKAKIAIPALIKILNNKNWDLFIRRDVAEALGNIKEPSAIPTLIDTLIEEKNTLPITALRPPYPLSIIILIAIRQIESIVDDKKLDNIKKMMEVNSSFIWYQKGLEYLAKGNKDKAIQCFGKAIVIDPDWEEPRENLKKCADQNSELYQAEKD